MKIWLKFWVNGDLVSIEENKNSITPQVGQIWSVTRLGDGSRVSLIVLTVTISTFPDETIVHVEATE